ncbi:MAG TPA: hypothetical protein VL997_15485 [Dyella sp.]|nr:hypothetical protein [Dyella sp.]
MQILSRSHAVLALVCLLAVAFATLPLAAVAQTSAGTVLFTRTVNGMVDGFSTPVSSAIFSIGDDGLHERQLTPYAQGEFNIPSVAGYDDLDVGNEGIWITNAFNPAGTYSVFVPAQSALPHYQDSAYHGKYVLINAYGERTSPMFYGPDDLESPSKGPGYGSVSWGPAGNDQIAYANVPDNQFGRHPACVRLMNSNGSNNHTLWCADRWNYCAVEAIRWSGDGSSLLVYAVHADHNFSNEADIYLINATTGAATLVEANIMEPNAGWGVGDISYDGHEVIYGVVYDTHDPGPCNVPNNNTGVFVVWCAKNMRTGQEVALTDPSHTVTFGFQGQALISPDGSQAFLFANTAPSGSNPNAEIYAVKTDGSGVRKITSPCIPMDADTSLWWRPVRVSPDGTRMLANCHAEHYPPSPIVYTNKVMVVSLADGNASFVTNGTAYDWHAQ